jgi:hypothetical protein
MSRYFGQLRGATHITHLAQQRSFVSTQRDASVAWEVVNTLVIVRNVFFATSGIAAREHGQSNVGLDDPQGLVNFVRRVASQHRSSM